MIASIATETSLTVLGALIRAARMQQHMSQSELAQRLDVSRQTVIAIEKGSTRVAIGAVFEAATILGIPLLSNEPDEIKQWQTILQNFNAILPSRINTPKEVDDDF
jgi:transcriptional regulator with XRE-family HTH domain